MSMVIYRVTGIALSLTVALLGATTAVLLYYAGQDGIDVFYKDSIYMDEQRRIHKRMPTDDWYGELILKGWAFGFIYVVPGLTGITASLFFEKIPMVIHVAIAIVALVVGSFLHTAGAMAIILFRVFTVNGVIRYDSWPSDCIYVRYSDGLQQDVTDEKCEAGRRALTLAIAAAAVTLFAWLFLLSGIVYSGFTFHNIGKGHKKSVTPTQSHDDDRPRKRTLLRRRRSPTAPPVSTTEPQPSTSQNNVYDDVIAQNAPATQTTNASSQSQPNVAMANASQQYDNQAYVDTEEAEDRGTEVSASDIPVTAEMVEVKHSESTAL